LICLPSFEVRSFEVSTNQQEASAAATLLLLALLVLVLVLVVAVVLMVVKVKVKVCSPLGLSTQTWPPNLETGVFLFGA